MIAVAGRHALSGGRRAARAARRALVTERQRQVATADTLAREDHEHRMAAWRRARLALIADGRDPDEAGERPVYVPPPASPRRAEMDEDDR